MYESLMSIQTMLPKMLCKTPVCVFSFFHFFPFFFFFSFSKYCRSVLPFYWQHAWFSFFFSLSRPFCRQTSLEKTNERLEEELQRLRAKAEQQHRERNALEQRLMEAEGTIGSLQEEKKQLQLQNGRDRQEEQEKAAKVGNRRIITLERRKKGS